jgi:hypothetical protein
MIHGLSLISCETGRDRKHISIHQASLLLSVRPIFQNGRDKQRMMVGAAISVDGCPVIRPFIRANPPPSRGRFPGLSACNYVVVLGHSCPARAAEEVAHTRLRSLCRSMYIALRHSSTARATDVANMRHRSLWRPMQKTGSRKSCSRSSHYPCYPRGRPFSGKSPR